MALDRKERGRLTTLAQSADGSNQGVHLLVVGPEKCATHPLPEAGLLTIGRAETADISIDDALISRSHARIYVGERIDIEDLGSANGTRIRGERLDPHVRTPLALGEAISLGSSVVILERMQAATRLPRFWTHGYFEGLLEEECVRARAEGEEFAVVRIQITEGAASENVVQRILESAFRSSDVFAVHASRDYEILLPSTSRDQAESLLSGAKELIGRAGSSTRTAIACFPIDGLVAEELVARTTARVRDIFSGATENESGVLIQEPSMVRLYSIVDRIARGTINVLLLGETGVGKEVLAQAVHDRSPRAGKPYLKLNCAAFSETLLESELFGHEKGAFTGAVRAKEGLLPAAHGGTVFLDEIGEMPMSLQAKLLRVIEAREVLPIGAQWPKKIDVRFIAATNRDLEAECHNKNFREDLYFRLNGFALQIPPLRERTSEIASFARMFLERASREAGRETKLRISTKAMEHLQRYSWPGNIRELRNVMEQAALLAEGDEVTEAHLPTEKMAASGSATRTAPEHNLDLSDSELAERSRIIAVLDKCAGNQTQAAKELGVSRGTLVSRLDRYRIVRPRKPK